MISLIVAVVLLNLHRTCSARRSWLSEEILSEIWLLVQFISRFVFGTGDKPMMSLTQLSNCLTLRGSFSSGSTATIARKGAFCSIFWALQDLHSFAPLRSQNFSKFSSQISSFFRNFSKKNTKFWQFSSQTSLKLDQILSEFHRLHRKRCKMPKIKRKPRKN